MLCPTESTVILIWNRTVTSRLKITHVDTSATWVCGDLPWETPLRVRTQVVQFMASAGYREQTVLVRAWLVLVVGTWRYWTWLFDVRISRPQSWIVDCVISGFRAPFVFYAAQNGSSVPTFRDICPLKMGVIGCPETSERNCLSTLRKIAEGRRSKLLGLYKSFPCLCRVGSEDRFNEQLKVLSATEL
jgi:hypothetical protein